MRNYTISSNASVFGFAVFFILVFSASLYSQSCRENFPGTNGIVKSIIIDETGNTVYIGGSFSYVGHYTGGGGILDAVLGSYDTSFPRINGDVLASIPDGKGGWFIGGEFSSINELKLHHLVHIRSDLSIDTVFTPEPDAGITAMVLKNNVLYVCGKFTEIGGKTRNCLAALDINNGSATPWNPAPASQSSKPTLYSLALGKNCLYLGGRFSKVGDTECTNIAKIDLVTGQAVKGWNCPVSNYVRAIAVYGKFVYLGGDFTKVNNIVRNRLAAVDTSSGAKLKDWNPNLDKSVYALAASEGKIYIGGKFTKVGGTGKRFLARFDTAASLPDSWNVVSDSFVNAIHVNSRLIYIGGEFHNISEHPRLHLARLDDSGSLQEWTTCSSGNIKCIYVYGSKVFAGGEFTSIGGEIRNNIACFDATTGKIKSQTIGTNGEINSMLLFGHRLYIAGQFSDAGGETRGNGAAFDITTGKVQAWDPQTDSCILSLTYGNNYIYVGGRFSHLRDQTRNAVAKVDINGAYADSWNPEVKGYISSLAYSDSVLYIGGQFSKVGNDYRSNIAAVYTSSALASKWNPGCDSAINCLAVSDSQVYIGGSTISFTGGKNRKYLAAINRFTGIAEAWDAKPDKAVHSLCLSGSTIYVGGNFTSIGGKTRRRLAALSAKGECKASTWDPSCNKEVYTIVTSASLKLVLAGGAFQTTSGDQHNSFVGLDDPYNNALPVELSGFFASSDGCNVKLWWTTETEINSFKFIVQKSSDLTGGVWLEIGEANASGYSFSPKEYTFCYKEPQSGKYYYRLKMVDNDGTFEYSSITEITVGLPENFVLMQNYPNPFNPATQISYQLPVQSHVLLKLFDVLGREIYVLVDMVQPAGYYSEELNAESIDLPSGIYFYRLIAKNTIDENMFVQSRKMLLIK